ncbi:hypothetical protein Tco_0987255 [Tanacetum coccineum]
MLHYESSPILREFICAVCIPFNPKQFYKDGVYTRKLWRPRYKDQEYTDEIILDYESRLSRFSPGRFTDIELSQDVAAEEIASEVFGAYLAGSLREIAIKAYLRDYWTGISFLDDFLTTLPSYTAIRDPLRRLCHRLIAFSISGRGQTPKKVTATDLFYLRSMD